MLLHYYSLVKEYFESDDPTPTAPSITKIFTKVKQYGKLNDIQTVPLPLALAELK